MLDVGEERRCGRPPGHVVRVGAGRRGANALDRAARLVAFRPAAAPSESAIPLGLLGLLFAVVGRPLQVPHQRATHTHVQEKPRQNQSGT